MRSDPRPAKRYRATLEEWEWFRTWFATSDCWVCAGPWQELHHILARSQGGDDDLTNLVPVCRECHGLIEARDPYARSRIRGALMPSNLEYLRGKFGGDRVEGWLERNYPTRAAA